MSYCEVQMESFLQWLLQSIIIFYFFASKSPSSVQFQSTFVSYLVTLLALTKTFLPSKILCTEKSLTGKMRKVLWVFCTANWLLLTDVNTLQFVILAWQIVDFSNLSSFLFISFYAVTVFYFFYLILMCLFILRDLISKLQQTKIGPN